MAVKWLKQEMLMRYFMTPNIHILGDSYHQCLGQQQIDARAKVELPELVKQRMKPMP